jgi:hypothetical protein
LALYPNTDAPRTAAQSAVASGISRVPHSLMDPREAAHDDWGLHVGRVRGLDAGEVGVVVELLVEDGEIRVEDGLLVANIHCIALLRLHRDLLGLVEARNILVICIASFDGVAFPVSFVI